MPYFKKAPLKCSLPQENGPELLNFHSIRIEDASGSEPVISSRHVDSGLLTKFWTYPAAIIPALVLCPEPGDSILIIGQPPAGTATPARWDA